MVSSSSDGQRVADGCLWPGGHPNPDACPDAHSYSDIGYSYGYLYPYCNRHADPDAHSDSYCHTGANSYPYPRSC